jgi:serine/threonine-protein kinase
MSMGESLSSNGSSAHAPVLRAEDRLESWKEIATYLDRGVSTVQRWERDEGLPVHRQQHDALGSVYAYKPELEAWRTRRAIQTEPDQSVQPKAPARRINPQWLRAAKAVGILLVGIVLGALVRNAFRTEPPRIIRRLTIAPSATAPLSLTNTDRSLAITQDGTRIIYVGGADGSRLFVRPLDQLDAMSIAGVGSPRHPFASPDGTWIGFFDRIVLKKVPITGGPPTIVMDGESDAFDAAGAEGESAQPNLRRLGSRGASWGSDNSIAFSLWGRLWRISSAGGRAELLASPDPSKGEEAFCWPQYLPGGTAVLFTITPTGDWSERGFRGSVENARIAVLDLKTHRYTVLVEGASNARYVDSGHLIFTVGGAIRAVPFDLRKLSVTGRPRTVIPRVQTGTRGAADFDVSRDGTLVYARGNIDNDLMTLAWVDRSGREEPVGAPAFVYRHPRVSPDGTRLALDSPRDLGIWDLSTRTLSWFGVGPTSQLVWAPDGRRLVFASNRGGPAQLSWQQVDGTQMATRLKPSSHNQFPNAISPDGSYLVLREDVATANLLVLNLANGDTKPLLPTSYRELNADFSPDGHFLAYQSNRSGQDDVYVQPFPNPLQKRWVISSGGGRQPKWSANGREIFYLSPRNVIMSVPITLHGGGITTEVASSLFDAARYYLGPTTTGGRSYDVSSRDGRFLMMKAADAAESSGDVPEIEVVLNWFEELKQARE